MTLSTFALTGALLLLGWVALHVLRPFRRLFSPLRVVPDPDEPHWLKVILIQS